VGEEEEGRRGGDGRRLDLGGGEKEGGRSRRMADQQKTDPRPRLPSALCCTYSSRGCKPWSTIPPAIQEPRNSTVIVLECD